MTDQELQSIMAATYANKRRAKYIADRPAYKALTSPAGLLCMALSGVGGACLGAGSFAAGKPTEDKLKAAGIGGLLGAAKAGIVAVSTARMIRQAEAAKAYARYIDKANKMSVDELGNAILKLDNAAQA